MKLVAAVRIALGLALLVLALFGPAHVRARPEPGRRDPRPTTEGPIRRGLPGKSVVVNSKQACEQLSSAGLGGPSCGPAWLPAADTTHTSGGLPITEAVLLGVCPALCMNGLGMDKCSCPFARPKAQLNLNPVCQSFCGTLNVQLNGCSPCDGSAPAGNADYVETTTPNWDEVCAMLCRVGDGGTLCNCDKAPFF